MNIFPVILQLILVTFLRGNDEIEIAEEIQHAVCTIASDEIHATANATITRQLKGVCTTTELNRRMNSLELSISKEMHYIKETLHRILQIAGEETSDIELDTIEFQEPKHAKVRQFTPVLKLIDMPLSEVDTTLKIDSANVRESEIAKANMSLNDNGQSKEFICYWQILNAEKYLDENTILVSDGIPIEKFNFYLKMHPNHLSHKYVSFELLESSYRRKRYELALINQRAMIGDFKSQLLGDTRVPLFRVASDQVRNIISTYDGTLIVMALIYL